MSWSRSAVECAALKAAPISRPSSAGLVTCVAPFAGRTLSRPARRGYRCDCARPRGYRNRVWSAQTKDSRQGRAREAPREVDIVAAGEVGGHDVASRREWADRGSNPRATDSSRVVLGDSSWCL